MGESGGGGEGAGAGEGEAAIDPFLGPCYRSLLGVVCDVISDAAAEEEAIGWMFPSSGALGQKPEEQAKLSQQSTLTI